MRMKKKSSGYRQVFILFIAMISLLMTFSTVSLADDYPVEVKHVKQSIKGSMLLSHIQFLASEHCRGREPGDKGMKVADEYIVSVLSGIGIEPAGDFGSYFQPVKLKTVELNENVQLTIQEGIGSGMVLKKAKLAWDYLPTIISAETSANASVVFAGYGITAPEHNYDDYKGIDARGKIVLVMRHEPGEKDPKSPFDGTKNSKYGTQLHKIQNAQAHGAIGILMVTDPLNHDDQGVENGGYMSGTSWPKLYEKRLKDDEDFKFYDFKRRMRIIGDDFGIKIPVVMVSGHIADYILGSQYSLRKIQAQIDKTMKGYSFAIPGKKVMMDIFFNDTVIPAHNIVAKVEGSDPELKDEIVIIGAHYDHVGRDNRGQVYGGADDNASGSSVVIELARAFKSLEIAPKRTILFILFTAEEKGLLGARYYADNPLFPLDKTVAFYNLDMVGRNDISQVSVLGKYQYPKLFEIVEAANKKSVNFDMNLNSEDSIKRSDQFPFLRKKIPSIYVNSAFHDDYHTPRDTVGKIVPEKVERIAHLVFLSLWDTANVPAGTSFK